MKTITTFILLLLCSNLVYAQKGTVLERSFIHNDSLRTYLLYVPDSYNGSSSWPLVLNFHGFFDTAEGQLAVSQMNIAADRAKYIVAYPQGLLVDNPASGFVGTGWNIGGTLSENDDLDFSKKVIRHIQNDYRIDQRRVHATGWSMGSSWSYELACNFSNGIASFAGVGNQMAQSQMDPCDPSGSMPFLQMHGTTDPIIAYDGFEVSGLVFDPAPETAAFWADINNCSPEPSITELRDVVPEDGSTVTLFEYSGCDSGASVRFYRINNGGHTWPGGGALPPFLGAVNQDIDASAHILSFFSRNSGHRSEAFDVAPGMIAADDSPLPTKLSIDAYPNPFAEQITVNFEMTESSNIHIALFDVTGRQVATVLDRGFSAGSHRIEWTANGERLSPGMYFLQFDMGGQQFTKPLLRLAR